MARRAKRSKRAFRSIGQGIATPDVRLSQKRAKFSGQAVRKDRHRLNLTLADYSELVGVSLNTIYGWEHSHSRARGAQLDNWLAVKDLPKEAAWKKLGIIATLNARLAKERAKFSREAVCRDRERLKLILTNYAKLVGVSKNTIHGWEHGHSRPLAAQFKKWLAARGMSKEAAWKKLGITEVPEFDGKAVLAERKRLGLSAAKYADLVGVSKVTVYKWEKGKSAPGGPGLEKWLAVKGLSKGAAWKKLGIEQKLAFNGQAVLAERKRLALTAKKYADLVGVSEITIYSWERGHSRPQAAQLAKWLAAKGMPRDAAWRRLGIKEAPKFNGRPVLAERKRLGLSAENYGRLIGVSHLTVRNWERGKHAPSGPALERLLAVRGMAKKAAWKQLGIEEVITDFDGRAARADRKRLELTARECAELVGVSEERIYEWECGHSLPRRGQYERWLAVKGMSREAAWRKLGFEEVPEFSAKAVLAERKRLGLPVKEYADLVGVSQRTVYMWEKGEWVASGQRLEKWLAVKGIGKAKAEKKLGLG